MKDRISTQVLENGAVRYAIYDEQGNFLRYEYMLAADEPIEEGTELNKENLLKDSTAQDLGLNLEENPTVDDALNVIGKKIPLKATDDEAKAGIDNSHFMVPSVSGRYIRDFMSDKMGRITSQSNISNIIIPSGVVIPNLYSELGNKSPWLMIYCPKYKTLNVFTFGSSGTFINKVYAKQKNGMRLLYTRSLTTPQVSYLLSDYSIVGKDRDVAYIHTETESGTTYKLLLVSLRYGHMIDLSRSDVVLNGSPLNSIKSVFSTDKYMGVIWNIGTADATSSTSTGLRVIAFSKTSATPVLTLFHISTSISSTNFTHAYFVGAYSTSYYSGRILGCSGDTVFVSQSGPFHAYIFALDLVKKTWTKIKTYDSAGFGSSMSFENYAFWLSPQFETEEYMYAFAFKAVPNSRSGFSTDLNVASLKVFRMSKSDYSDNMADLFASPYTATAVTAPDSSIALAINSGSCTVASANKSTVVRVDLSTLSISSISKKLVTGLLNLQKVTSPCLLNGSTLLNYGNNVIDMDTLETITYVTPYTSTYSVSGILIESGKAIGLGVPEVFDTNNQNYVLLSQDFDMYRFSKVSSTHPDSIAYSVESTLRLALMEDV